MNIENYGLHGVRFIENGFVLTYVTYKRDWTIATEKDHARLQTLPRNWIAI